MSSQNQALAEAFKSIREFLTAQQARLYILEKRTNNLEEEQINRIENISENLKQQLIKFDVVHKKQFEDLKQGHFDVLEGLKNLEEQGESRFNLLEPQIKKLEQGQKRFDNLEQQIKELEQGQIAIINERLNHFEPILHRFGDLETKLKDTELITQKMAKVLPNAIREATTQQFNPKTTSFKYEKAGLADSLQEPVEHCLRQSVREDTSFFADILFPVMGPAIRKSINESLKNIVQSINQTAEQSISPQGLAWRVQAWRSGQSFSEIVLQKTLLYRVEQVFLIHRETGLLIQHLHQKGVEIGDSDAVSAMFTAIQDFILDSFSSSKTEELNSVEIGDYTVWLERGPYATLACVIRGAAPPNFRNLMHVMLETLHAHYGLLLKKFDGDSQPLEPCLPLLEQTLQSEAKSDAKSSRLLSIPLIGILSVILLALLGWGYFHFEYQQRLINYINALQKTPGIVVVSTKYQDGKFIIFGMRDPLSAEPQKITQHYELSDDVKTFWTPYQDLTPQFVEQRIHQQLVPPSTVSIHLQEHILTLKGYASQDWINKAQAIQIAGVHKVVIDELLETDQSLLALAQRELAPPESVTITVQKRILQITGNVDSSTFKALQEGIENLPKSPEEFAGFEMSGLKDVEREMGDMIKYIEKTRLYFYQGTTELMPDQKKTKQALQKSAQKLLLLTQILHKPIQIHIIGNADGIGSKHRNQQLSQQRAEWVFNWLQSFGIEKRHLFITSPALIRFNENEPNQNDRNVSFEIKD